MNHKTITRTEANRLGIDPDHSYGVVSAKFDNLWASAVNAEEAVQKALDYMKVNDREMLRGVADLLEVE